MSIRKTAGQCTHHLEGHMFQSTATSISLHDLVSNAHANHGFKDSKRDPCYKYYSISGQCGNRSCNLTVSLIPATSLTVSRVHQSESLVLHNCSNRVAEAFHQTPRSNANHHITSHPPSTCHYPYYTCTVLYRWQQEASSSSVGQ